MAHAAAQGNRDFFMFGEVFDGDPAYASRFTTELPFPSVLDFGFDGAATNFAARSAATDQLRDFFAGDDYYHRRRQQRLRAGQVHQQPRRRPRWLQRSTAPTRAPPTRTRGAR